MSVQQHEGPRRSDLVVIGLGYVGLPLSQAAVRAGLRVTGFDRNAEVVRGLNAGRSHIDDISDAELALMLEGGFTASADAAVIARASSIVICVPTPLTEHGAPNLAAVDSAVAAVAAHLRPGMLVVLESTTYPGTTEDVVRPALEAGGLRVGVDFNLAFSPSGSIPATRASGWRTPRRWSAAAHRTARRPPGGSTSASWARWWKPRARARPRCRSCWRTRTGRSTSPW